MTRKKKTQNEASGILGIIPKNTPAWSLGIAVIIVSVFTFYPSFSKEINAYLDYKKTSTAQTHQLSTKKLDLKGSLDAEGLKALAAISMENAKALRRQAEQIGSLTAKIHNLEEKLKNKSIALEQCLQELNRGNR